jgi:hypothetical protein
MNDGWHSSGVAKRNNRCNLTREVQGRYICIVQRQYKVALSINHKPYRRISYVRGMIGCRRLNEMRCVDCELMMRDEMKEKTIVSPRNETELQPRRNLMKTENVKACLLGLGLTTYNYNIQIYL